ncbi:vesicular transport factor Uso1p [Campylobacter curvus]|uniref:vesicular transport factor Uso1p n=1 Tax=Campylobacter curvus TaxID=200 RepID=UPI00036DC973|nr:vesicular transport factor Uso1p [Campylobacter curvus]QKF61344.1 putative chromosome segregation ATPase [Campylobacter curvus]UEB49658.1 hypothetical protein LK426_08570 [Campylobacter curvus]
MDISKILLAVFCVLLGFGGAWFVLENPAIRAGGESNQTIFNITFDNLPEEEKQKYISKDDLYEYGGYITPKSYTQNFVAKDDKPLSSNVEELQNLVRELAQKNEILAADNVDMSEKNLEFISKISQMKKVTDEEKNEIVAHNSKVLGELEAQHFENIQALTKRLNEAQADMIESSKGYEKKIVDLENAINDAKVHDEQNLKALNDEFAKFKDTAEANFTALDKQNTQLKEQLEQKTSALEQLEQGSQSMNQQKQKELDTLKTELAASSEDMRTLRFSHEKELATLNDGFEMQKRTMEDELSKKSNKILDLQSALEASQDALKNSTFELNEIKKNLNTKDLAVENYSGKNLELNASLATLHKSFDELKQKNLKTERELKSGQETIENFKKELEKSMDKTKKLLAQNADANASIKELSQKLATSNEALKNANKELALLNDKNMKNIKILGEQNATISTQNQKISSTDESLKTLTQKLGSKDASIKNLENNITELNAKLTAKQNELEMQRRTLKIDMQNYEILRQQINMLEKKIVDTSLMFMDSNKSGVKNLIALQNELDATRSALNESNKTIQRLNLKINQLSSGGSKEQVNAQIVELQKDIEQNLNRQDELENENVNLKTILQATTKPETPTKLVLISSLQCDDMDAKDKISIMCKNRVSEFLQRFNSNYIYEIIPIVDKRNFVIPSSIAQGIKKDDLGRLNNYVNYGVGKERAMAAAELIKDEFGDFARISFSSEVIVRDVTRGFVIKVYR